MAVQTEINEDKLNEFVGKFAGDLGAVLHAATVLIGDKLGLYKAMSDGEPVTAAELAEKTNTDKRHMREWLSAQAASLMKGIGLGDRTSLARAGLRQYEALRRGLWLYGILTAAV